MNSVDLRKARAGFSEYLHSVLIGPRGGTAEEFEGSPFLRYMMGMLFPREGETELAGDGTDESDKSADDDANGSAQPARRALPSSVGLSFLCAPGTTLDCSLGAARYVETGAAGARKDRSGVKWRRVAVPADGDERVRINPAKPPGRLEVLGGSASLYAVVRPWAGGQHLVTVTLVNETKKRRAGKLDASEALFQVRLVVSPKVGRIVAYPRPPSATMGDDEAREVAYLYRDAPVYGRGHGAAVDWEMDEHGDCTALSVSFMPTAEVRAPTFEVEVGAELDARYCDIEFLATNTDVHATQVVLSGLATAFGGWLGEQERLAASNGEGVGLLLANRCREWQQRICDGIALLADQVVFDAFRLANRAMYWQMHMASVGKDGPFAAKDRRRVPDAQPGLGYKWRPFQIAFFLGTIASLVDDATLGRFQITNGYRDVVDVIWFPTGGGKTEAYLLVAAFELVRRRLVLGDGDEATAVLSRYTLRMLTAQQFQRTGMLIAALELLRRNQPSKLGTRPFSLGLWVGGGDQGLTPNKFADAVGKLDEMRKAARDPHAKNPFLLDRCPACSTSIVDAHAGALGIECDANKFRFHCLSPECEFCDGIPMQVVDEALYRDPPSILLGTLDKFAGLAWDPRPAAFFGGASGNAPPPSLVIQDELHLISGPLGSICAPYEVAIDSVIRARNHGRGAKVIASTATIRNAMEQVRGIYGRGSTVFPSPVRHWDDAFFFRLEDSAKVPGRLYIGAMGQGTTTPVVSMVWTVAALLQASKELRLPGSLADAYWTVLVYLNSRRELGRTLTAASQEIPDRIKAIASAEDRARSVDRVLELSSQMTRDMSEAIRELSRRGTPKEPAVDVVPCTSIISVGVDVDRLGLMMVNGQPKLTSEYIQASSRVGRSREAPGFVLALYSPAKPRDRSHYEDFRAYHESFYRYVEPTSVTPYAPPARARTLHAAIVAMIRQGTQYGENDQAGSVTAGDPEVKALLHAFIGRVRNADSDEQGAVDDLVDKFMEEWEEQAKAGGAMYYSSPGKQFHAGSVALLRDFGQPETYGWYEAMRSVRNVDPDVALKPVGRE